IIETGARSGRHRGGDSGSAHCGAARPSVRIGIRRAGARDRHDPRNQRRQIGYAVSVDVEASSGLAVGGIGVVWTIRAMQAVGGEAFPTSTVARSQRYGSGGGGYPNDLRARARELFRGGAVEKLLEDDLDDRQPTVGVPDDAILHQRGAPRSMLLTIGAETYATVGVACVAGGKVARRQFRRIRRRGLVVRSTNRDAALDPPGR